MPGPHPDRRSISATTCRAWRAGHRSRRAGRVGDRRTGSADPSVHGQHVTFTAEVGSTGESPSGTVQFKVDGSDEGAPQTLDGTGHASILVSDLAVGSHPVSAEFTSDNPDVQSSSGGLDRRAVLLASDRRRQRDTVDHRRLVRQPVRVRRGGHLQRDRRRSSRPGGGTPTGTIQFQDNGVNLGAPIALDGIGSASFSTFDARRRLAHDHRRRTRATPRTSTAAPACSTRPSTPRARRSSTPATRPRTSTIRRCSPRGSSGRTTARRFPGEDIAFTMSDRIVRGEHGRRRQRVVHASRRANRLRRTPSDASFAGDTDYQASSASVPFVVTKEETTTVYTGPTAVLQGHPVMLAGQLLEDGVKPIAGRTLTLTLGSGRAELRHRSDQPFGQRFVLGAGDGRARATAAERRVRRRRLLPAVGRRVEDGDRVRVPVARRLRDRPFRPACRP